jgi:hypothetical protein
MAAVPGEGEVTPGVAVTLAGAAELGADFPPGVPDTPGNRALFEEIRASIAAMPEGVSPDLPWDYADGAGTE